MFSLPFDDSSSQLDLPSLLQANVNSVTHHHHQQQHLRGGSPPRGSASMGWEERTKKSAGTLITFNVYKNYELS